MRETFILYYEGISQNILILKEELNMEDERTELMVNENEDDIEVIDLEPEEETGSGKKVAVGLGISAAVVALGALAYRKFKPKKNGKPRRKKRLRWVEVDDEDFDDDLYDEDFTDEEVVDEDSDEEETSEKK